MATEAAAIATRALGKIEEHEKTCAERFRDIKEQTKDLPVMRDRQNFIIRGLGWGLAFLIVTMCSAIGALLMLVIQGP